MLTKNEVKYIRSLRSGKFRQIHKEYIAEGSKLVTELLQHGDVVGRLYATADFFAEYEHLISKSKLAYKVVTADELKKISGLTTPHKALAVVPIPDNHWDENKRLPSGLYLMLDNLQDPGNVGTIIRSAAWFGVNGIFCSFDTVDVYNPKVVQASMGSLFRLPVYYGDLTKLLERQSHLTSYAAVLQGKNVYKCMLKNNAILVIGNESKGIRSQLLELCAEKITIPRFGTAESLNAAVACSILLALWRR